MTWPTRDDYINGASIPSWAGGPPNYEGTVNEGEDFNPCPDCGVPYDCDCEYDCECDTCCLDDTKYSACCGARIDPNLVGFCPQCRENC